jgi:glycosyltransferase involved in cell wall biosynthesis
MASGRPIIISTEGESRRLVESSGAGLAAAREDSIDLARKISSLRENSAMRDEMSHNGLSFVLANSSRARHADDFLAILVRLARGDISQQTVKKAGHTTEDMNRSKEKAEVLF